MSFCLSVCLSAVCLSVVCLSFCLFVCLFVCLSQILSQTFWQRFTSRRQRDEWRWMGLMKAIYVLQQENDRWLSLLSCQKHAERVGFFNFAADGCEILTPTKNSLKEMYCLKLEATVKTRPKFAELNNLLPKS